MEPKAKSRRFRKLVILIKLILKAFVGKRSYVYKSSRAIFPPESPVKTSGRSHALSLQQLSQPGLLQSISHKIQQRLQRQSTPNQAAVQKKTEMPTTSSGQCLEPEVQLILTNSSWTRSHFEIHLVLERLKAYDAFMDYPLDVQRSLCKVAHYQRLEEGRLVFCEGRQPVSFYLLLSGKVQLVKRTREDDTEILQTLTSGESFGDTAIIEKESRSASCIVVQDATELLVISKSDFLDLSLRQSSRRYQKNKHFLFCRTIPVLKSWPIEELEEHHELCIVQYFKPNVVVTKDSRKCEWIYVIMSGTCRVVKKFRDVSWSSEPSIQSSRGAKGKRVLFPDLPEPDEEVVQSRMLHTKHGMTASVSSGELESRNSRKPMHLKQSRTTTDLQHTEGSKVPHPVRKQFLMQLQILHPKDIFGLSSMVHDAEPPITLVSNGAEVIMISKQFIKRHLTDYLKAKLQKQVMEYPSEEAMMKRIKDHHTWSSFK